MDNVVNHLQQRIIADKNQQINTLRDRINKLEKEVEQLKSENKDKTREKLSQTNAAVALGALFSKHKSRNNKNYYKKQKIRSFDDETGKYAQLFKKYEEMLRLGINLHGAIGRMRADGCDKAALEAFEKKHDVQPIIDVSKLGLKPKKQIVVGKNIKMQRLLWDPISVERISNSVWGYIDESTIHYDKKHFEAHFKVREIKMSIYNAAKPLKINQKKITFGFISKQWRCDVLFGLKKFNLTNGEIRQALLNMDENIMTVDRLSQLLKIVPTIEQELVNRKLFSQRTCAISDYGRVEQFFCTLCDFHNLKKRLKLWIFKQTFQAMHSFVSEQCRIIQRACDKVRNNKKLRLLLTVILVFGNHMNSNTRNGAIYGFDIKILTQLKNIKDITLNRSLLMYIYEFCDCEYLFANDQYYSLKLTKTVVKTASLMEFKTLTNVYQQMKFNMMEIKNLIYCHEELKNKADNVDHRFITEMSTFHKRNVRKMSKFNMHFGNTNVSAKRVMKKFCYGTEDSPRTIESFFEIWNNFFDDLSAAKGKFLKSKKAGFKYLLSGYVRTGSMKYIPVDILQLIYNYIEYISTFIKEGSWLYKEFEKMNVFEKHKINLHYKLIAHINEKIRFIGNGGRLNGQSHQNATMRRVSIMYQHKINNNSERV